MIQMKESNVRIVVVAFTQPFQALANRRMREFGHVSMRQFICIPERAVEQSNIHLQFGEPLADVPSSQSLRPRIMVRKKQQVGAASLNEMQCRGLLSLVHVKTQYQLADALTKLSPRPVLELLRSVCAGTHTWAEATPALGDGPS